jgi:hypothetical protein
MPPPLPVFNEVILRAFAGAECPPREVISVSGVISAQHFLQKCISPVLTAASNELWDLQQARDKTGDPLPLPHIPGVTSRSVEAGGPLVLFEIDLCRITFTAPPESEGGEQWISVKYIDEPERRLNTPWDPNEIVGIVDTFLCRAIPAAAEEPKRTSPPAEVPKVSAVRKAFGDARRNALLTQGPITMEKVRENQKTMKDVGGMEDVRTKRNPPPFAPPAD